MTTTTEQIAAGLHKVQDHKFRSAVELLMFDDEPDVNGNHLYPEQRQKTLEAVWEAVRAIIKEQPNDQ